MSVFSNIWKIKELRTRILFTLGIIFICRVLSVVPIPGVDAGALLDFFRRARESGGAQGLMGTFDLFSGGALSQCAVGALTIWPYISASIVIQLMTSIVPALERMAREGETGRQKLNQTTRYLTLALCLVQSFSIAKVLASGQSLFGVQIVAAPGAAFYVTTMLTVTAASMFTMWMGEQITERGVGNGASIIIMVNICSRLPVAIVQAAQKFIPAGGQPAELNAIHLGVMVVIAFVVFAGTIAVTQALRRIPIHTARRSIGASRVVGGTDSYIPLRVNFAGVMPIIFAGPILRVLGFVFSRINIKGFGWLKSFGESLKDGRADWSYLICFAVLIIFFSFFWVATQFHAVRMADDLKSSNGYIPGIRPGLPTAEFLDLTMTRVTFIGALALVCIAISPAVLSSVIGIPPAIADFFGGTSLLIIVGVGLDTLRQVESYLVMRNYEGFLKHGHIRGRR
jgi:preprotein translocase, SecY subunit